MNVSDNSNMECEFHTCVRHVMRLPRWVGFFPVSGLNKPSINQLRCKTRSFCYIFNILLIISQFIICCLSFYYFSTDIKLVNFTKIIFYSTSFLSVVCFSILAKRWPKLMRDVAELEQSFGLIRTQKPNVWKFVSYSYAIVFLGIIEHILSLNYKLTFLMNCMKARSINYDVLLNYVHVYVAHVFRFTAFSLWKAALYKLINLHSTFIWTFSDVFILCVGMYLSNLFRNINKTISEQITQNSVNWSLIRQQYSQVMKLLKVANENLSSLILVSFFTNIYYVCLQMFYSTNRAYDPHQGCPDKDVILSIDGIEYTAYYVYSLLFLLVRSYISSMLAVQVNTEALKPLSALRCVPSQEYTLDVQRFSRQIRYCNPALSGICFSVTKQMLLSAMATVMTYEVVLLQNSRTRSLGYNLTDFEGTNKNMSLTHFM